MDTRNARTQDDAEISVWLANNVQNVDKAVEQLPQTEADYSFLQPVPVAGRFHKPEKTAETNQLQNAPGKSGNLLRRLAETAVVLSIAAGSALACKEILSLKDDQSIAEPQKAPSPVLPKIQPAPAVSHKKPAPFHPKPLKFPPAPEGSENGVWL